MLDTTNITTMIGNILGSRNLDSAHAKITNRVILMKLLLLKGYLFFFIIIFFKKRVSSNCLVLFKIKSDNLKKIKSMSFVNRGSSLLHLYMHTMN